MPCSKQARQTSSLPWFHSKVVPCSKQAHRTLSLSWSNSKVVPYGKQARRTSSLSRSNPKVVPCSKQGRWTSSLPRSDPNVPYIIHNQKETSKTKQETRYLENTFHFITNLHLITRFIFVVILYYTRLSCYNHYKVQMLGAA